MPFLDDITLDTTVIAKKLLGCLLVYEKDGMRKSGWIVETEAYLGKKDAAAHTYQGHRSPRVEVLYSPAGTFYIHQMMQHTMINVSTKVDGCPEGILIRAIEPFEGEIEMAKNRPGHSGKYSLTDGPGKLTQALGVTMAEYNTRFDESPLMIDVINNRRIPQTIIEGPRIGIPNKGEWTEAPLRFTVAGNPYVSRRKGKIAKETHGWVK